MLLPCNRLGSICCTKKLSSAAMGINYPSSGDPEPGAAWLHTSYSRLAGWPRCWSCKTRLAMAFLSCTQLINCLVSTPGSATRAMKATKGIFPAFCIPAEQVTGFVPRPGSQQIYQAVLSLRKFSTTSKHSLPNFTAKHSQNRRRYMTKQNMAQPCMTVFRACCNTHLRPGKG